jgi:hypothetical protein
MNLELTERHVENLKAITEGGKDGILRSALPHPRLVKFLKNHNLAEVCGEGWIARITITELGLEALRENQENG